MLARGIILNSSPNISEGYSYKVPFYSAYRKVCYLNRLKEGIDIGFVRGFELSDPHEALVDEGRKMVKSLRYQSMDDFNEEILLETMQEALVLDEYHHKSKNR